MDALRKRLADSGVLALALSGGDTFTIRQPISFTITRGRAWVTVEGRRDDWFLQPGERFTAPRGRQTVVQADPACTLSIERESFGRLGLR